MVKTNFLEAAGRHWRDAETLRESERWPNADQLYGLAAECALKAVMQGLGMGLDSQERPQEKHHRVHIEKLWGEFQSFAQGRGGARYAQHLSGKNPFSDWAMAQRYWQSRHIRRDAAEAHREGAERARTVLSWARQDGVL